MTLALQMELESIVLPPSVVALLEEREHPEQHELSEERLTRISQALGKLRDEAIKGRRADDIDKIMMHCEEAYAGIDDANRGHFRGRWRKPTTGEGPVIVETGQKGEDGKVRSSAFARMTARYVEIGSAKVAEILLPADDKAFAFSATPVPEVVDGLKDARQLVEHGIPLTREPTEAERAQEHAASPLALQGAAPSALPTGGAAVPAPPPGGAGAPGKPLQVKDLAKEASNHANDRAKKAERRIFDWLVESHYRSHMRKVLFDAARLGSGVIKGPYAMVKRAMKMIKRNEQGVIEPRVIMEEKVIPGVKWVSTWNFFPHPVCGEDVQNGDYIWEREMITRRTLRGLKRDTFYITEQIDKVLKEGPGKLLVDHSEVADVNPLRIEQFEIWHFNGWMAKADFLALNRDPELKPESLDEEIHVLATMVNDHVIRAVQQPLDSGELTYYVMPWVRRPGCWLGTGVSEQLDMPQRLLNGALRAMINNAGITAGAQIAIDKGAIIPADGVWEITPDKLWLKKDGSTIDDIRKAIVSLPLINVTPQLLTIVELAFRLAEESTNIPLITQGQSGKTQPNTLGGMQLQDSNANQLLRDIAYNCDDCLTERMIRAFYEWLLLDPDVPDEEKGDFHIFARGSAALVERAIQKEMIAAIAGYVKDPSFRIKPDRWMETWLKSGKIDPRDLQYTDDEWEVLQNQPPPKPFQVQIAELRAQVDVMRAKLDTDRDNVYVQAENERTRLEHAARMKELDAKINLELVKYATQRQISVEAAKVELASTVMKLRTQKELAAHDRAGEALTPPTEPPGRAPAGESFQK